MALFAPLPRSRYWRDGLVHGRRHRLWYLELDQPPLEVDAPSWLLVGALVFDEQRWCWGRVMDLGWPRERRQRNRAWLRPPHGGREWNPRTSHLSPDGPTVLLFGDSRTGDIQ